MVHHELRVEGARLVKRLKPPDKIGEHYTLREVLRGVQLSGGGARATQGLI